MPVRATKRGAARTPLGARDCDVLVCGASFAGLAVARELQGSGMRVLMIDRYELGERQTSACAMPTAWLEAMDLMGSLRQAFDSLLVHTRVRTSRWPLPWSFSTFDYRELCALLYDQADAAETELETATVTGRTGLVVHTDRGDLTAPLIVDAPGWRRVLSNGVGGRPGGHPIQPPNARLSRGLEVHPAGAGDELELWIDHRYVRAGYAWSFPAREEVRIGAGSFWPSRHVKEPTVRLAGERGLPLEGYQGNWIPHQLRAAVEDGGFFAGGSAWRAPGSCARWERASSRASRRSPATARSPTRMRANTPGSCARSARSGSSRPHASPRCSHTPWSRAGSPTGRSRTTWTSLRRRLRASAHPARARPRR